MSRLTRTVAAAAATLLAAASSGACGDGDDHAAQGELDGSVRHADASNDGGGHPATDNSEPEAGPLWHLNDALRGGDLGEPAQSNLFYSPLSIGTALGMVYAGAAGDTELELHTLLAPGRTFDEFHADLGQLFSTLVSMEPGGNTLQIANAIFPRPGFELEPAYQQTLADRYRAAIMVTDFASPEAASMINKWTSEQTGGHIPKLFEEGQLDATTVCALVNAIYFKATWKTSFDTANTGNQSFTLESGEKVTVSMMHGEGMPARMGEIGRAQVLELPYQGDDLRFVAILPGYGQTVADLESDLATEDVSTALKATRNVHAKVAMPRFTMRSRLDLIPPLRKLGVTTLFEPGANLTRMSASTDMFIDVVVHEAWVAVDENGTEAAAATGAAGQEFSDPSITLNSPFLFLIRDAKSGAILFEGRVMDPR
ncbi:MAG: serpin family protein [Myxococcales bacterium]